MSGAKRKVEELGGHVLSAAVGDVVARTMSTAVGRYEACTSVDDQLERLGTLAIMVHSAVEAAEGVHIRSWWLRRWLWKLRDAALDADEVLRLFRQRRAAEETTDEASKQAAGNTVWTAAWAWGALRSVRSMLFGRDDRGIERLHRAVARLEREAMGLGDFLKVLELEIRRSLSPAVQSSEPPVDVRDVLDAIEGGCIMMSRKHARASARGGDRSRFDHGLSSISHEEYVAGMRKMGLVIVRQHIRRVLEWFMIISRKPPAAPPASRAPAPDTDRLRELVSRIQRAVSATGGTVAALDLYRKRSWLAMWRSQLLALAWGREYQLLAVFARRAGGDGADVMEGPWGSSDGRMRSAAPNMEVAAHIVKNVETAAAYLDEFVMLTGFALAIQSKVQLSQPRAVAQIIFQG